MWSRRLFLRSGALAAVAWGGPWRLAAATALAPSEQDAAPGVLVTVFLRGAMDGLAAVPPLTDPQLATLRPGLLQGARPGDPRPVELDGRFGLHPALAPLGEAWSAGRLAVIHAVGSPHPTRSHFDAQDFMETGFPGRRSADTGWLGRAARHMPDAASPFAVVGLAPRPQRSLDGAPGALTTDALPRLRIPDGGDGLYIDRLRRLYADAEPEALAARGRAALAAVETALARDLHRARPARGAVYPPTRLGRSLQQIAALVKADVGLRIATTESGGWDTHMAQGSSNGGFARAADDLARSLAAFWRDLEQHREGVAVLTMTEFGRTVAENGSGGTDHGHGSAMFLMGGRVDGGRVHGEVPELGVDTLHEGRDLPATTDFRSVFAEVAGAHLGIEQPWRLFPGWSPRRIPLFLGR